MGTMGTVVLYGGRREGHEAKTRREIARQLATLKGYEIGGEHDGAQHEAPLYFVPADTLASETAASLGIRHEQDLFGGVVPQSFVATKIITHPLVDERALAVPGWSPRFSRDVRASVLAGYSVFAAEDAQRAASRLFERGTVRLKPPHGIGGRGQRVVRDAGELCDVLGELEADALATNGMVLEENLDDVETYSVGQVQLDDLLISYVGTQRLTPDNGNRSVYGGTDLLLARGEFAALLALPLPDVERAAVSQALVYDRAAYAAFDGFFASRRNYDVARGRNGRGERCAGVLEQSWRIGGASGIELAALEAFHADPELPAVRASSYEIYGGRDSAPAGAKIYFDGDDEEVGRLLKYTVVKEHVGHAR